jgi:hypothetical protein
LRRCTSQMIKGRNWRAQNRSITFRRHPLSQSSNWLDKRTVGKTANETRITSCRHQLPSSPHHCKLNMISDTFLESSFVAALSVHGMIHTTSVRNSKSNHHCSSTRHYSCPNPLDRFVRLSFLAGLLLFKRRERTEVFCSWYWIEQVFVNLRGCETWVELDPGSLLYVSDNFLS